MLIVDPASAQDIETELARLGLAHWRIGDVVTAGGDDRVRID